MLILTATDIRDMIRHIGLDDFFKRAVAALQEDFGRWNSFRLSPRHATNYPNGVIELMPCSDRQLYAFKYVNGHPTNVHDGKLSVVATGQISDAENGYPLMFCDMTLLTAIRTAATSVLAAAYLARSDAKSLAMIGTGAQSEFQAIAFANFFPIDSVRFFDNDRDAMAKFSRNLSSRPFELTPSGSIDEAIRQADIITTATTSLKAQTLFEAGDIAPGTHINAIGGDCPGKTELPKELLNQTKLVVEYTPQSSIEGEIQQGDASWIDAELWELVCGTKACRENDREITLFDSVGFALEDFSMLRIVHQLAKELRLGSDIPLLPEVSDPKDLFGFLS